MTKLDHFILGMLFICNLLLGSLLIGFETNIKKRYANLEDRISQIENKKPINDEGIIDYAAN
jgi:hypothetical protein